VVLRRSGSWTLAGRVYEPTATVRSVEELQESVPISSSLIRASFLVVRPFVDDELAVNATTRAEGWAYNVSTCGSGLELKVRRGGIVTERELLGVLIQTGEDLSTILRARQSICL
jgi:hypothetical protein